MTFEEIDKRFEKGEYKRPEKLDLDWKKSYQKPMYLTRTWL